jgi:hypothetical protein
VATCAHSEVTVDGKTEVADAGEILLPQQVTSSAVVQVPPLNLAALQAASPPTIRLATPTGSSHSSDKSVHKGTEHGADSVSTPNTSTKVQGHSSAGENSIFATPGEVQPNRMGNSPPIPRICALIFTTSRLFSRRGGHATAHGGHRWKSR